MTKKNSRHGIVLFVIGVVFAGLCNALARIFVAFNYSFEKTGGTESFRFSQPCFSRLIWLFICS